MVAALTIFDQQVSARSELTLDCASSGHNRLANSFGELGYRVWAADGIDNVFLVWNVTDEPPSAHGRRSS
jgi:hypothetical protein